MLSQVHSNIVGLIQLLYDPVLVEKHGFFK